VTSPYAVLGLAVLCISFGSILVRLTEAPPLAVSFYRIALAALFLAPTSASRARAAWPALPGRFRLALLGSGLALALHFATWVTSLQHTSIASSVLLVNTAPIFAVVLAWLFLGERASGVVLGGIALALVGAVLIAAGDWTGAPRSLTGSLLAVAGAVTLAAYHVSGRGLREALPLTAYVFLVWSVAAAVLLVLCLGLQVPLGGYGPRTIACFLGLALVPTLAGHGLVNRSLRSLPAPTVGLFMLGEPIGASILGYLFFGEVPGAAALAGGFLVLCALALVLARGR
jgi:drug/metabolite transporter (DMT)-like permease